MFLTPDELAARWRVTRRTLHNYEKQGKLPKPVVLPGGRKLYRLEDVERMEHELAAG
jgi:DNA-binding transcriptional MerR regulator